MERSVQFVPGGGGIIGFVGTESGCGMALRNNGEEILFASRENAPLRWVKVEEFTADPAGILSAEEARQGSEEEDD